MFLAWDPATADFPFHLRNGLKPTMTKDHHGRPKRLTLKGDAKLGRKLVRSDHARSIIRRSLAEKIIEKKHTHFDSLRRGEVHLRQHLRRHRPLRPHRGSCGGGRQGRRRQRRHQAAGDPPGRPRDQSPLFTVRR